MASHSNDMDMTRGTIWKQLVHYSLPMAVGILFQQLYNTVDTIIVGQFVGTQALAAVGSTGSLINSLVGFANGMSLGSAIVVSQTYGAKDPKKLHTAVHTIIALSFIVSAVITLLGVVFARPLLVLMATPDDVIEEATTYLTIYFGGISGLLIYNMGADILRAVGDSKRPLYFLIVSAIINVIGDLLFVLVFKMGVAGVAYATILAQFISCCLVLYTLSTERGDYGLHWKEIRLDKEMFKRIFKIGMPNGIQQAVTAFSNVFVQSYINFFGSTAMAGYSVYNKLDAFMYIPLNSISSFNSTFVGQNYGAGQNSRAREGVKTSVIIGSILTSVLACALILLRYPAMQLFTSEPDVQAMGANFIKLISPFYLFICIFYCFMGAVRGTGDCTRPMIGTLTCFVLIRQIYLAFIRANGNDMIMITMGYPFGWVLCAFVSFFLYRHSRLFHSDRTPSSPAEPKAL